MTQCPTCGREDFKNRYGMKIHHRQVHGESIAGVAISCAVCGDIFQAYPSTVEDRETCSRECKDKLHGEKMTKKPLEMECVGCGDTFTAKDQDRIFCSVSCYRSHQSDWLEQTNAMEPQRKDPIEIQCANCGSTFSAPPSREDRVVCSMECYGQYFSENYSGRDSPHYEGGRVDDYGENWPKKRLERIRYDDETCVVCGMSRERHRDTYGSDIEVHHIVPREKFKDEEGRLKEEIANNLENLVTLCKGCHKKWEGVPLRPEVDA